MFQPGYNTILFRPTIHCPKPKQKEVSVVVVVIDWAGRGRTNVNSWHLIFNSFDLYLSVLKIFISLVIVISYVAVDSHISQYVCKHVRECV